MLEQRKNERKKRKIVQRKEKEFRSVIEDIKSIKKERMLNEGSNVDKEPRKNYMDERKGSKEEMEVNEPRESKEAEEKIESKQGEKIKDND